MDAPAAKRVCDAGKYLRFTVHCDKHWNERSYWLPWPEDLMPSPDTFVDYGRVFDALDYPLKQQATPEKDACLAMFRALYRVASEEIAREQNKACSSPRPLPDDAPWPADWDMDVHWSEAVLRAVKSRGGGFLLDDGQVGERGADGKAVVAVARPGCLAIHGTIDFCG